MNRAYKSIYNESTGTYVAVSEHATSRGKRSSSRVNRVAAAVVAAATAGLVAGAAAQTVPEDNEIKFQSPAGQINFTDSGSINFGGNGSITGLANLMVGEDLDVEGNANVDGKLDVGGDTNLKKLTAGQSKLTSLEVSNNATVGGTLGVTGKTTLNELSAGATTLSGPTQVNSTLGVSGATTLNKLTANNTKINGTLGVAGTTTLDGATTVNNTLNVTGKTTLNELSAGATTLAGNTTVNSAGIQTNVVDATTVNASTVNITDGGPTLSSDGIDMKGKTIIGLEGGILGENSTDVVTGGQIYDYFLQNASGVRYFHANSAEEDSIASGEESIAIGPQTVSEGESSFAAGDRAKTTEGAKNAIALGTEAQAGTDESDGEASIAIGNKSQAAGNSTIAFGDGAKVASKHVTGSMALGQGAIVSGGTSNNAIAVGTASAASAERATAIGHEAQAGGIGSAAFGAGSNASGGGSIALGGSSASAANAFAAGTGAEVQTANSISLGAGAGVGTLPHDPGADDGEDRTDHIAIGTNAGQYVTGNQTTAIGRGAGSKVIGDYNIAIGDEAGSELSGDRNVAIGYQANKEAGDNVHRAIAVGDRANAKTDGIALGTKADAKRNAVALGRKASASEDGVAIGHNAGAADRHIALGHNSFAGSDDLKDASGDPAIAYLTNDSFTGGTVLSVGNSGSATPLRRRIVNVAAGANEHDAVNVGQLKAAQNSVKNLIGSHVTVNSDGTFDGYIVQFQDHDDPAVMHEYTTVEDALYAIHSGKLGVALPPGTLTLNADGSLTVEKEASDTMEVVTLGQLTQAIDENGVQYFSVNATGMGNEDNMGAQGSNAMAIGPGATAGGESSLAIGHDTDADGKHSVAVGHDVTAEGEDSIVLGSHSNVYGKGGVAIGLEAISQGENSIAIGTGAETDPKAGSTVDNAIAIGTKAESTADDGVAIGHHALASDVKAVAQGYYAYASGESSLAFGTRARATAKNAQASGTRASASGESSQAYGTRAEASGVNAQASGTRAEAIGNDSIATGTRSIAWATDGVAIGRRAEAGFQVSDPQDEDEVARNKNSIAIGNHAKATDLDALAVGRSAEANEEKAAAFGDDAEASAERALAAGASSLASGVDAAAFGSGAQATAANALASGADAKAIETNAAAFGAGARAYAENATALGAGAKALHNRSVALGDGSETAGAVGTSGFSWSGETYEYAGTNPIGTVSVGKAADGTNPAEERTITNVAAGRVSAVSTDAINGSQLFQTQKAMGKSIAGALGGDSDYDPNTFTVTADLNVRDEVNNFTNVEEALQYVGQGWNVGVNKESTPENVAPGDTVDFSNNDGNIVIDRTGTDLTFDLSNELTLGGDDEDGKLTVTGEGGKQVVLDGGMGTIGMTGAGGTTITNIGVKAGDPNLRGTGITRIYYNDGGEDVQVATLGDGLKFAGDDFGTDGTVDRKLNETLNLTGGATGDLSDNNIGVVQNATGDGFDIKLAQNINLGEDGSVTIADGGDGSVLDQSGLSVADGDIETTVAGTGVTVTDTLSGASTDVGAGLIEVSGGGADAPTVTIDGNTGTIVGLTNKDLEVDGFGEVGRAATEEQLKLVSDTANAGWNVSVGGEGKTTDNNVAPDGVVDFSNTDGNIVISREDTDLTFDLSNELTLGDADEDGKLTVTGQGGKAVVLNGSTGMIGMTGAGATTITNIGVKAGDPNLGGTGITRIYYNDGGDDVQVATLGDGLKFAGDDFGTDGTVDRKLNETLNLTGGATGDLSDNNIGVVQNATGDGFDIKLAQNIDLGEDGSVKIGDSKLNNDGLSVEDAAGNKTQTAATGTTVVDGSGNKTETKATGVTVTGDDGTTNVGAGAITVTGTAPDASTITIDGNEGTIGGLTNTTWDGKNYVSGQAATEDQLKRVSDTANAGWNVSTSQDKTGNTSNVGPDGKVDFAGDKNITIGHTQDPDGNVAVTVALDKDIDLGDDGSLTVGKTKVTDDGVKVGEKVTLDEDGLTIEDGDKKTQTTVDGMTVSDGDDQTIVAATGTTVTDGSGNKTETKATGVTVTDGSGASTDVGAGLIEVSGGGTDAPTITIDGNEGTIGGLTNTSWDGKNYVSGQAATEDQLKLVSDTANMGWNVGVNKDGTTQKVAPGATVDFSNTDDNIVIKRDGTDLTFDLAKHVELDPDGSLTVGQTKVDDSGVAVGDDVHLGDTGLVIKDGPSVTKDGIDAGGQKITNVAEGEVSATSKDAINGSQLHALAETPLTFGGDFGTNVDRKLGDTLEIMGGATNEAHLTDGNIGVVADGQDKLEVKLNKDIDLGSDGSVKVGRTRVDDRGVQVGNDVQLTDQGLIINNGPSVTRGGIDAGGKQITNVAAGTQNDHAVNLGQLKGGLSNLDNQLTRKGMNFAGNAGSTHRDLGQTMHIVGSNSNLTTAVTAPGVLEIALNNNLILESVTADKVMANEVEAGSVKAGTVEADRVVAGQVAADDVLAGRVIADEVHAGDVNADNVNAGNVNADNVNAGNVNADRVTAGNVTADTVDAGQVSADHITTVVIDADQVNTNHVHAGAVSTDVVTINNGGPIISDQGIDMSGKRITNVAPGVHANDAVNVGQLTAVQNNLQGQIHDVRRDLRRTDKKLSAGVAAAMATASLPQAYLPGKNMVAVAGGTWNGESGMAIGFSGISDNGKWVYKLSGNASSRGDYGGTVGVGYQW